MPPDSSSLPGSPSWVSECCEQPPSAEGVTVVPYDNQTVAVGRCGRCRTLTPFYDEDSDPATGQDDPPKFPHGEREEELAGIIRRNREALRDPATWRVSPTAFQRGERKGDSVAPACVWPQDNYERAEIDALRAAEDAVRQGTDDYDRQINEPTPDDLRHGARDWTRQGRD